MLRRVASTPSLVDAVVLPEGTGVDAVLSDLATDPATAEGMDAVISAAVAAYEEPSSPNPEEPA